MLFRSLNAGTDFNETTTPFDMGLGRFVDMDKADFIGKAALEQASKETRMTGLKCPDAAPLIQGEVMQGDRVIGRVTAGEVSPFLQHGIGFVLLDQSSHQNGEAVRIRCVDGQMHEGELHALPFYDEQAEIPRGKKVDIPERP